MESNAFTDQPFLYVLDPTSDGRVAEIRFRDCRKNMPLEWRYRIEMVK